MERLLDVLLFSQELYDGQSAGAGGMLPVLLMDEDKGVGEAYRGFEKINKYQRISNIYKNILELYAQVSTDAGIRGKDRARIVAVYSPLGGSGKTTIALSTATKLANLPNLEKVVVPSYYTDVIEAVKQYVPEDKVTVK